MVDDMQSSMLGDPVIRLSSTTGRRTFTGGGLQPQRFVRPVGFNDPDELELAPMRINARRALNRTRGIP